MTDRDWETEMKKIDRAMGKVSDDTLVASAKAPVASSAAFRTGSVSPPTAKSRFGMFARLGLAVALGVGIAFWPYGARCGGGLAAYLGAVLVLVTAGGWSAISAWGHRSGRTHVLALLILVWGLVLASIEVLPRVGYAIPTVSHPADWTCS